MAMVVAKNIIANTKDGNGNNVLGSSSDSGASHNADKMAMESSVVKY